MKYFKLLLVLSFACGQVDSNNQTSDIPTDTMYVAANEVRNQWDREHSIAIISNPIREEAQLTVGRTDTMSIEVFRFEKYPVIIKNERNCSVEKLNYKFNHFAVTPDSVNCAFEVWQDYDSGKVIMRMKLPSTEDSITYQYRPMNGEHEIASMSLSKYVANKQ